MLAFNPKRALDISFDKTISTESFFLFSLWLLVKNGQEFRLPFA
jgi:hypothetical protein